MTNYNGIGVQVKFINTDDEVIGFIELKEEMATLIDIGDINEICVKFREVFHTMGEPLNFKIEYTA